MVIEELVATLGFRATNLGDLRKFEGALEGAKRKLSAFGTALNANLFGKLKGATTGFLPKLGNALKSSTANVAAFERTLGAVALVAVKVAGGIALVTAAVAAMAYAFVRARGEAARLRRAMQITASGNRTRAVDVEKLGLGMVAAGGTKEMAGELVESLADKINESIRESGGAPEGLKKRGVRVLDRAGNQRNTTAIAIDTILAFLKGEEKARAARAKAEKSGKKGDLDRANVAERDQRQMAEDFGLPKGLVAVLRSLPSVAAFVERMEQFNRDNPTRTRQEEDETAVRAQKWAELSNKIDGILSALANQFARLGNAIFDYLIDPMTQFATAVIAFLKRVNWLPETAGEKAAREASERAAADAEVKRERAQPDFARPKPGDSPEVRRAKEMLPKDRDPTVSEFAFGSPQESGLAKLFSRLKEYAFLKDQLDRSLGRGAQGSGVDLLRKQLAEAEARLKEQADHLDRERNAPPVPPARPGEPQRQGSLLEKIQDQIKAMSPAAAANQNLVATLTGSAEVSGKADFSVLVRIDPSGINETIARKTAELKGQLNAIGRSSATGLGTATAGAGTA